MASSRQIHADRAFSPDAIALFRGAFFVLALYIWTVHLPASLWMALATASHKQVMGFLSHPSAGREVFFFQGLLFETVMVSMYLSTKLRLGYIIRMTLRLLLSELMLVLTVACAVHFIDPALALMVRDFFTDGSEMRDYALCVLGLQMFIGGLFFAKVLSDRLPGASGGRVMGVMGGVMSGVMECVVSCCCVAVCTRQVSFQCVIRDITY